MYSFESSSKQMSFNKLSQISYFTSKTDYSCTQLARGVRISQLTRRRRLILKCREFKCHVLLNRPMGSWKPPGVTHAYLGLWLDRRSEVDHSSRQVECRCAWGRAHYITFPFTQSCTHWETKTPTYGCRFPAVTNSIDPLASWTQCKCIQWTAAVRNKMKTGHLV